MGRKRHRRIFTVLVKGNTMKTVRFDYCKGETARAYTVSGLHDGEDLSGEYVLAEDVQRLAAESRATVLQLEYLRDKGITGVAAVTKALIQKRIEATNEALKDFPSPPIEVKP